MNIPLNTLFHIFEVIEYVPQSLMQENNKSHREIIIINPMDFKVSCFLSSLFLVLEDFF